MPYMHLDDVPRRATRHNTFPAESPHVGGHRLVNYNSVGDPVRVASTIMASGVATYAVRERSAFAPDATWAGLVWCPDLGTLRAPRMLAVALATGVPCDLEDETLLHMACQKAAVFGAATGLHAPSESDYRKHVGNAFQIDVVRCWWRQRGGVLATTPPEGSSAAPASFPPSSPTSHDADGSEDGPSGPTAGSDCGLSRHMTGSDASDNSEVSAWGELEDHPEERELETLGEELRRPQLLQEDAHGRAPLGRAFAEHVPDPDPRYPDSPAPPDVPRIIREVRAALWALRELQLDPRAATLGAG